MAGTGMLWLGRVVSASSLGVGQMGAEAGGVSEEDTKTLSRDSGIGEGPGKAGQD